jgi:hypothetical protein
MPAVTISPGHRRSQHSAENKTMPLIEQRIAAFGPQIAIVLRQEQRL